MGKIKNKLAYYRKKADAAMQEYYREQDLKCEVCSGIYSCKHHFFTKKLSAVLRYDERNLISICQGCHTRHHQASDPRIHAKILENRGFEWHHNLEVENRKIIKPSIKYYKTIIDKFK